MSQIPTDPIYFDNAATSWPKPPGVGAAMLRHLATVGGSPGRAGHRLAVEAGRVVYDVRDALAELLGADGPESVVLLKNATEALNLAILGTLEPGDRVVVSALEHNSVMRPLRHLEETSGVTIDVVECGPDGTLSTDGLARALKEPARMVIVAHASNVTGALAPIGLVADIAHTVGATLLVDAAQTAGAYTIDVTEMGIDLLAFTGHKSLFGPQGTGGLVINSEPPRPLMYGGTGSNSEEERQPGLYPDRLESGTLNGVGFAGLGAGLEYIRERTVEAIEARSHARTSRLLEGLLAIDGVQVHGPADPERQTSVVSITFDRRSPAEAGLLLDDDFGVLTRVGLHCSPAAHRSIGTFPTGTVRLSASDMTPLDHLEQALAAVGELAR